MSHALMRRRDFLSRAWACAAALPFLAAPRTRGAERPPNFVFILSDDQGWTTSSVLMDGARADSRSDFFLTPNLERLAGQGMRFTQGYAPAALCCPSRRSIQFGQTPVRQGEARFAAAYPAGSGRLSIPRMLKSVSGKYAAAHFGKWDLRSGLLPEHLGYDESDGDTGNRNGNEGTGFNKQDKWTEYKDLDDPKRIFSITERAIGFMERQVCDDRPFYLQVSHYAVHVDMQTRAETRKKFEGKARGAIHRNAAFAGMLEDLDSGVGMLLDKLDDLGIAESTYVIYMADNGAVPWIPPDRKKLLANPAALSDKSRNYPLRGGKWTLYEGGVRVPFIVRGPGVAAGSFCEAPVAGWDLLPTLADLAGYASPMAADIDGASFRTLLEHGDAGTVARPFEGLVFHRCTDGYEHTVLRLGDYKLVKFWEPESVLLFNIREDLGETVDLAAAQPALAEALHQKLMAYLQSVDAEVLQPGQPRTGPDEE